MHVLIIEDSKTEAHIFAQTLKRVIEEPVDVSHSGTLGDALGQLAAGAEKFDLVFLDLRLPDSAEWRHTYDAVAPYARRVPVIVMSGDGDPAVARAVVSAGAEDYIVKGGKKRHVDMLKETIDLALCRHKAVRELADSAEKGEQCIQWLSGGYSVE